MLSVNKPLMQQVFSNMLMENGPFYNAAYDAQYATMEHTAKKQLEAMAMLDNTSVGGESFPEVNKQEWKEVSKVFAKAFIKALKDGKFDKTLADEIDKHVKSTELFITMMPQGIATIISPMGPCTGTMIINNSTANIKLL